MPERKTVEKARKDKRAGKAPTAQAGEFIHEEIRKVRRGEHGARSPKQAIAIGLSKALRAGVALRPPGKAKPKRKPAGAPNTPMSPTRASESRADARASPARCRRC